MIQHSALLLASALGGASACDYARDWSVLTATDGERYAEVLNNLDLAIRSKDFEYVSKITFVPIGLSCGKSLIEVKDRMKLASCYRLVFDGKFLSDLYKDQCLDVHVSWRGVRIGAEGGLWLQDVDSGAGFSLVITTINN